MAYHPTFPTDTWGAYLRAHAAFLATPTPTAAQSAIDAYKVWVTEFSPADAGILVADFEARIAAAGVVA